VLRIRDILVQIRGSVYLTKGSRFLSDSGSRNFRQRHSRWQQKFFSLLVFEARFREYRKAFFMVKNILEKNRKMMIERSGARAEPRTNLSGSMWPNNTWIRIRNTALSQKTPEVQIFLFKIAGRNACPHP